MTITLIALFLIYLIIAYQDLKDREVNWILFPLTAIFMAIIYLDKVSTTQFCIVVLTNLLLITAVLLILLLYTKFIRGKEFLNVSFGLGDVLFLYAFAFGFPTITFLVLFTASILFSIVIFQILSQKKHADSIPLAGFMSIFLIAAYTLNLFSITTSLFII